MKKILLTIIMTVLLLPLATTSFGASSENYTMTKDVISGGGETSTSTNYSLTGTVGQGAVGHTVATSNHLVVGFWNTDTIGVNPPTSSLLVNSDDEFTGITGVELAHSSAGTDGVVTEMMISQDGVFDDEAWVPYASLSSLTLSGADGTNTVYAKYRDDVGLVSFVSSDSIGLDTINPVDGSINVTPDNSQVQIDWSGFSDATSGLSSYTLVYSNSGLDPVDCSSAIVLYTGSGTTYTQTFLVNGDSYNYRLCASDVVGHQSVGVTNNSTPVVAGGDGISFPPYDTSLVGISRDGGASDDSNNLDSSTGNALSDALFDFIMVLKDGSGLTPQSVTLMLSDRVTPSDPVDFTAYPMTCTTNVISGATCSFSTELGPAFNHNYYFVAILNDGSAVRYPDVSGVVAGPEIELLTGYNIVGIPRDLSGVNLEGVDAFSTALTNRWLSGGLSTDNGATSYGSYEVITSTVAVTSPVAEGEGYFVWKGINTTMPNLDSYTNVAGATYSIPLTVGWNLVSNPYSGNILLSNVEVVKDSGTPVAWADAVDSNMFANALYQYDGVDWGKTYTLRSAGGVDEATLVPWVGYWVYLRKNDGVYELVVNKP